MHKENIDREGEGLRIVNIIQRYPPAVGGSETWCREISCFLAQRGHDVRVLTMNVNYEEEFWQDRSRRKENPPFKFFEQDGLVSVRRYRHTPPVFILHHLLFKRILDWQFGIQFYGPHSIEMYAKMWRQIKQANVVMLHTLPFPHNYVGLFVGKILRKPVVIVPHFHPEHPDYERPSHYWLLNKCNVIIADTCFEAEHLVKHGVKSAKVNIAGVGVHLDQYHPHDLDLWRQKIEFEWGIRPGDNVIAFVGRKMENKGIAILIEAVKRFASELSVKLVLAGPAFEWFRVLYAQLPSDDRQFIIDAGVLTHQEKVNLLHSSKLLVLPSKFESFGVVFLEAWACGIPVIGTTEGAMPEVIGDAGWTVPYGDAAALAAAIRSALAEPQVLCEMGERGRRKVQQQFSWPIIGHKVEEIITTQTKRTPRSIRETTPS
ncbi:MAG: glycosyltransferase family 4 protein [Ignavibacteriae bacterium]|nr:glycosyltransferase family 4 protein [Ignavibacteria bacterium]MBI3364615.1 glycosyltransferase family 4 protein [Ignavibacteriota bacterium]